MKRAILMGLVVALVAQPGTGTVSAQASSGSFQFFKNYFVTGDYVVGGVGLRGSGGAPQSILVGGVPANADILGAFLYWQSVVPSSTLASASSGVTFEGQPIGGVTDAEGTIATLVNTGGSSPCWSAGGATGTSNGSKTLAIFRADVLRFIDDINVRTGKLAINVDDRIAAGIPGGGFSLQVPDGSNGNSLPLALGASLVIIYRDTITQPAQPLRSIVMYDGGFTMDQGTDRFTTGLAGFYQPRSVGATARLTPIVGDGQSNFPENIAVSSVAGNGVVLGTTTFDNQFVGAQGADWDNPLLSVAMPANARSVTLDVNRVGLSTFDCLSFAAVVLSTEVQDTDDDGLLDVWEQPQATPLLDPKGEVLPNLYAMGARPNQKDIFFEVGYMTSRDAECTNAGTLADHCHRPSKAVVDTVAQAFLNGGVVPHFDIGSAAEYHTTPPTPWIVPAALARGGEAIVESSCGPTATPTCQFPVVPGVVGWKTGYQKLRDEVVGGVERFDANRRDSFRYVLFAHALGLARSEAEPNVPAKTSGIADPPGGDLMVTLGFWDNFIGTPFMQASTWLHEAGHTLGLRHFGVPTLDDNGEPVYEPNCKPNYQSVMNYLFQTRGLICDAAFDPALTPACAGKAGLPVIDLSHQSLNSLNEVSLNELNPGLGKLAYRPRWYSSQSFIEGPLGTTGPTKYCDGTPAPPGTLMYRVEGTSLTAPVDWLNDGVSNSNVSENINFNQNATEVLRAGTNDWASMDLRHTGSRRNVAGLSLGVTAGDLGKGDLGKGDLGKGDLGKGDLGKGDLGKGDLGKGDLGKGDLGIPPSDDAPAGDLDLDTARHVGNAPTLLVPVVGKQTITLNWTAPHVDAVNVASYSVYRVTGSTVTPTNFAARVWVTGGPVTGTTAVDTNVKNNTTYTYFVLADFNTGARSGVSNFQTAIK